MPLTVENIIQVAKVSEYLAANDIAKGTLFGQKAKPAPETAKIIYMERKAVEYMYDRDPSNETLTATANYLYALCNRYVLQAQVVVNGSTGGGEVVTPGGTPSSWLYYDYFITEEDVTNNFISIPALVGKQVMQVFMSGILRGSSNILSDVDFDTAPTDEDSFTFYSPTGTLYYMTASGLTNKAWLRIFYITP